MKVNFKELFVLFGIIVFTSCDRPECLNTNAVFENNAAESDIYKHELASKLRSLDNSTLTYWFDHYTRLSDQDIIYVNIQGQGLCAIAALSVDDWTGLEDIKRTAGKGYSGAELVGLKIDIAQDENSTELVYNGVRKIRD